MKESMETMRNFSSGFATNYLKETLESTTTCMMKGYVQSNYKCEHNTGAEGKKVKITVFLSFF